MKTKMLLIRKELAENAALLKTQGVQVSSPKKHTTEPHCIRFVYIDGKPSGHIIDTAPPAEQWPHMHPNTRAAYVAAGYSEPAQVCSECGEETSDFMHCPDGAEICRACFDAGAH